MKKLVTLILAILCFSSCTKVNNKNESSETQSSFTIFLDADGGYSESNSYVKIQEVKSFEDIQFPLDMKKGISAFRGWALNGGIVIDQHGVVLRNIKLTQHEVFKAIYRDTVIVNLNTNLEGSCKLVGSGEYSYNTSITISCTVNPSFIENKIWHNYIFDGFYQNDELLTTENEYTIQLGTSDLTIIAKCHIEEIPLVTY